MKSCETCKYETCDVCRECKYEPKETVEVKKTCQTCKLLKNGCVGCAPHRMQHWQPIKEEETTVEKTYTTGQMIDMLLENPKRKAQVKRG